MSTFCTFCGTYSYNQEYLVCHLEFIFRMIEWELTTSLYSFFSSAMFRLPLVAVFSMAARFGMLLFSDQIFKCLCRMAARRTQFIN